LATADVEKMRDFSYLQEAALNAPEKNRVFPERAGPVHWL
jgi:hypothetical protein